VGDGGRPVAVNVARELEREAAVLRLMDGMAGFPALRYHHKVRRHYRDAITNANRGNNERDPHHRGGKRHKERERVGLSMRCGREHAQTCAAHARTRTRPWSHL